MTITFLVGNGFDIAAGINTSYSGFYGWYINQSPRTEDKHGAIKNFKEEIDKYMRIKDPAERQKSRWADFEIGLGQYTDKFTKETVDDFLELYEDAHEGLCTYLENECSKFDNDIADPDTIAGLKDGIAHFYQELKPTERDSVANLLIGDRAHDTVVKFISFNYTDSLDAVAKVLSKTPLQTWEYGGATRKMIAQSSVLHAHGTTSNAPILGVFDDSQVANKELLNCPGIRQALIKSRSVQTAGERWYSEADQQIDNSQIICIWGMSLGITDARWWKKIVSWLRANPAHQVVVFWHMGNPPSGRSFVNTYMVKRDVVRRLCAFSKLAETDIESLENRIHVVINTDKVLKVSFDRVLIPASDEELRSFILGSFGTKEHATV